MRRKSTRRTRSPVTVLDRRAALKACLLGASIAFPVIFATNGAGADTLNAGPQKDSDGLSHEDARRLGLILFAYEIPDEDATTVAGTAESNLRSWRSIAARYLPPVNAPFDFNLVLLEARRLASS